MSALSAPRPSSASSTRATDTVAHLPGVVEGSGLDELTRVAGLIAAAIETVVEGKPQVVRTAPRGAAAVGANAIAAANVPVVLMHHQGDPTSMQDAPRYDDALVSIADGLGLLAVSSVFEQLARHFAHQSVHDPLTGLANRLLLAEGVRRLPAAVPGSVTRSALLEFLGAGVSYAFPAEAGPEARGVPTSHAAGVLGNGFSTADPLVWPSVDGGVRGASVNPLYASAAATATQNPALYELLALVDAIRLGRTRERTRAKHVLRERLLGLAEASAGE